VQAKNARGGPTTACGWGKNKSEKKPPEGKPAWGEKYKGGEKKLKATPLTGSHRLVGGHGKGKEHQP